MNKDVEAFQPLAEFIEENGPLGFIPIEIPFDGGAFFSRTDFDAWDVLDGLQNLYASRSLPTEAEDFVRALFLAFSGQHPKFRLRIEKPESGKEFAKSAKTHRHVLATNISQRIDVSVARGAKLEAEVEQACAETGLSRREIFRFLKETRERRAQALALANFEGRKVAWPLPDGLTIDGDGKIVPDTSRG